MIACIHLRASGCVTIFGASLVTTKPFYVFLCDDKTRDELERLQLVGTTHNYWKSAFMELQTGDVAIIYDRSQYVAFGPYTIVEIGMNIISSAWRSRFPAQARISPIGASIITVDVSELNKIAEGKFLIKGRDTPHSRFDGDVGLNLMSRFKCDKQSTHGDPRMEPARAEASPAPRTPARAEASPALKTTEGFRTSQGYTVRSKAERAIADWLYYRNIVSHYEINIPDSDYRCDFFLPRYDIYIEYWGMPESPEYRTRMLDKQAHYRMKGLRLIELFPADEHDLHAALCRELRKFGVAEDTQGFLSRLLRWFKRLIGR